MSSTSKESPFRSHEPPEWFMLLACTMPIWWLSIWLFLLPKLLKAMALPVSSLPLYVVSTLGPFLTTGLLIGYSAWFRKRFIPIVGTWTIVAVVAGLSIPIPVIMRIIMEHT